MSTRKQNGKVVRHRVPKTAPKPLTAEDMALADAALGIAESDGHPVPPTRAEVNLARHIAKSVPLKRTVKPISADLHGKGKTTKVSARLRKSQAQTAEIMAKAQKDAKIIVNEMNSAMSSAAGEEAEPESEDTGPGNAALTAATKCEVCGKPLSKHSSMEQGMGDVCASRKIALAALGMTVKEYRQTITANEIPKDAVKFVVAGAAAHNMGFSWPTFMKAIGGNRAILAPLNNNFKITYVGGTRYLPGSVMKHLDDLKTLAATSTNGKTPKTDKPKTPKTAKAAKRTSAPKPRATAAKKTPKTAKGAVKGTAKV